MGCVNRRDRERDWFVASAQTEVKNNIVYNHELINMTDNMSVNRL